MLILAGGCHPDHKHNSRMDLAELHSNISFTLSQLVTSPRMVMGTASSWQQQKLSRTTPHPPTSNLSCPVPLPTHSCQQVVLSDLSVDRGTKPSHFFHLASRGDICQTRSHQDSLAVFPTNIQCSCPPPLFFNEHASYLENLMFSDFCDPLWHLQGRSRSFNEPWSSVQ